MAPADRQAADNERIEEVAYGAILAAECAQALRLPAATAALALATYQRYFARVSPRTSSVVWSACAALLLAVKLDSSGRRLRDVASVAYSRLSPDSAPLDYYGAAGHIWKQEISRAEVEMLGALGFRIRVDTPHKLVLVFANTLREKSGAPDWLDPRAQRWHGLLEAAWANANDVMRVPEGALLCVEDLACACIQRAAVSVGVQLPGDWVRVFGAQAEAVDAGVGALDALCAAVKSAPKLRDLAQAGIRQSCGKSGNAI